MIEIYKGYQVKPHKTYPSSIVVAVDGKGGGIPDVLNTLFTSRGVAKTAIDNYIEMKPVKKETVYASKAKPTGGDK